MIRLRRSTKMSDLHKKPGLDEFIYLRDEIRGQHEIMNHRMSWFAATQSLLYSAYASSTAKEMALFRESLIPTVGLLLCILMIPAVMSANERISSLRRVLKSRAHNFRDLYPINTDRCHYKAQLYPLCVPWVFLVSWVFVVGMKIFK
jgi:hypothetical protein